MPWGKGVDNRSVRRFQRLSAVVDADFLADGAAIEVVVGAVARPIDHLAVVGIDVVEGGGAAVEARKGCRTAVFAGKIDSRLSGAHRRIPRQRGGRRGGVPLGI